MIDRLWKHAGLTCALRHGALGAPCGYVALPEGHPLYGARYEEADVSVDAYGGVTWCGALKEDPSLWCVGFDMGHACDFVGCVCIRTDGECARETDRLAERLAEMLDDPPGGR